MSFVVDAVSVVHAGELRAGPPATGIEPQRDALLRAHLGWLALVEANVSDFDEVFCVVLEDDDEARIK